MRRKLELERDFTLCDIVDDISRSKEHWMAFSAFIQHAMREKEEEERRRERARHNSSTPSSDWDDDTDG